MTGINVIFFFTSCGASFFLRKSDLIKYENDTIFMCFTGKKTIKRKMDFNLVYMEVNVENEIKRNN